MKELKSKTREVETITTKGRELCFVEVMDDSEAPDVRKGDMILICPKAPKNALALVRWY